MKLFPFTLWHGTSAHLLPTIKEHGLGGRHVMAEWGVMDFLKWAFPQIGVAEYDFDDPDCMELMPIRSAVNGGSAGLNFEYNSVYLAGGYDKAADYAQTAPELVSFVRTIQQVAERRGIHSISRGLADYPELTEFLKLDIKPVVLKLPPLPQTLIQNERGGPAGMPSASDDGGVNMHLWSQIAFRLTEVIPFQGIEVIDASNDQRSTLL
jgi:hypothetical protein